MAPRHIYASRLSRPVAAYRLVSGLDALLDDLSDRTVPLTHEEANIRGLALALRSNIVSYVNHSY